MISKNKHSKPVWVIGYWPATSSVESNLRFVCNLVLVYWFLHKMQRNNNLDSNALRVKAQEIVFLSSGIRFIITVTKKRQIGCNRFLFINDYMKTIAFLYWLL